MNQENSKNKENAKDERSENNCVDTRIKHDKYVVCTKEYH